MLKQQYLSSLPAKVNGTGATPTNLYAPAGAKKQTTTKKSRYDDSYLSENTTPTKLVPSQHVEQASTFEIPEDEERSGSSYSHMEHNLNFYNHPGSVHQRQQCDEGIFDAGLRESINSTSTLAREMESLVVDEVFTDRTNMANNGVASPVDKLLQPVLIRKKQPSMGMKILDELGVRKSNTKVNTASAT